MTKESKVVNTAANKALGKGVVPPKPKELELWEKWNKFVTLLAAARDYWETEIKGLTRKEVEQFGGRKAKILHLYRLVKFEVMIPRFIDYYRGYGGLDAMKVDKGEE